MDYSEGEIPASLFAAENQQVGWDFSPVGYVWYQGNAGKDVSGGIIRNIGELDGIIENDSIRRPAIFFMFAFINELEIIVDDINKWQNERRKFFIIKMAAGFNKGVEIMLFEII